MDDESPATPWPLQPHEEQYGDDPVKNKALWKKRHPGHPYPGDTPKETDERTD